MINNLDAKFSLPFPFLLKKIWLLYFQSEAAAKSVREANLNWILKDRVALYTEIILWFHGALEQVHDLGVLLDCQF